MSLTDDRGFHLQVFEYGKKVQHHHDTEISRFMKRSHEIVEEALRDRGTIQDPDNQEPIARNLEFKFTTV